MKNLRYIAIEGPIGVGKTTLAKLLAEEFQADLVLEEPEKNPFLPDFYKSPNRFAFQTEVFFMLSRYRQQSELAQQDLFTQMKIADYIFAKDWIFAQNNLSEAEFELYQSIYSLLDTQIPKPDLVIFLQASVDVLRKRIKKRGISHEKYISGRYIETLCQTYNHYFFQYDETPLLTVNCTETDIVRNHDDYKEILKGILHMKKNQIDKHYVSISSQ
ncbi:MAG: deoxynucleoside kinase [Deltaproteobacteria bacterium]|nr:deoxynucleoside kinase [Deltaproteobacteria bacterium]